MSDALFGPAGPGGVRPTLSEHERRERARAAREELRLLQARRAREEAEALEAARRKRERESVIPRQPDWVSVREIAVTLGVSRMTVYRLIDSGELPAFRVGRNVRVERAALLGFIADARTTR